MRDRYRLNIHPALTAGLVFILLLGLWQIRGILLLALAAILLTTLVSIPVRLLSRLGLRRPVAIVIANLGLVLSVVVVSLLVLPTLLEQFAVLTREVIPQGFERLSAEFNDLVSSNRLPFLGNFVDADMRVSEDLINQLLQQITSALGQLGGSVLPLVNNVANTLFSILIVFFLCLYFLAEPNRYVDGAVQLVPLWYRDRAREIAGIAGMTLEAWLRVTGVSMVAAGVGTGVGLALIGIQQWAALGVLTGLLSFIPNFGTIAAIIPAVAVGIVQAPEFLGLIIAIILGVSFVQSQVLSPILASENMNLPPVLILLGQIIAGVLFGFMGLLLAVPIIALLMTFVREVYIKDILGDHIHISPEE